MSDTPISKVLPPERPANHVPRPRLEARVNEALRRRLTVVNAEAGFGKSTMLVSWWDAAPAVWYTADRSDRDLTAFARRLSGALRVRLPQLPAELDRLADAASAPEPEQLGRADALASRLAGVLHDQLSSDLLVIVDDVHELPESGASTRLIEALCRHAPPRLHLVLSGRTRPPFAIERMRGRGQLLEIDGNQLAFTVAEVAQLLDATLQSRDTMAEEIRALTGGWPAAVIFVLEAIREQSAEAWPGIRAMLERPGAPLFAYLAEEVFAHQPSRLRSLIARLAWLPSFNLELCEALQRHSARAVESLARQGLLVEGRADGSLGLPPLIERYARDHLTLDDDAVRVVRLTACDWYSAAGDAERALELATSARDARRVMALLESAGDRLLSGGRVATVLEACEAIPQESRGAAIARLEGDARQVQGDWNGALACFERAAAGNALPASIAWRIGVIHYLRGDFSAAHEVLRQGLSDAAATDADQALVLAWSATVHWVQSDVENCRALAVRALQTAQHCGDHRALAAAHTVMAMLAALDGDRRSNDEHYLLALRAAELAPDVLQAVRIHTNRGSHFMEEGSYAEALQELEAAVRLGEMTSFASFVALALSNRGEVKFRTGRIDEALADLEASRARYIGIGSDMVAYPLEVIGEVHRERGNLAQARAVLEEAIAVAERSGDIQGLAPSLAALATVVAYDDPATANQLAQRAVDLGTGMGYAAALVAAGWVAHATGDDGAANSKASNAAAVARSRHDRPALAEALTLLALTTADARSRRQRLTEAAAIWQEIGNPLGVAKVELVLASLEPGSQSRGLRRQAELKLEHFGVTLGASLAAGALAAVRGGEQAPLRIQTLGAFAVIRDGNVVPMSEWQSKRARELLKLLVARRGRAAPRTFLMETLWPGEDPERLANRLSVALTTVRTILDPGHRLAQDAYVNADSDAVSLNISAVDVDVESFLAVSAEGMRCMRANEIDAGIALLEEALGTYAGDFLEDNLYADWAVPLREEARAACIATARALGAQRLKMGEPDPAVACFLRILAIDPYDEEAHLSVVAALAGLGRHGEAHRHYLGYRRAMDDLGVEPAPFPAGSPGVRTGERPAFSVP